MLVLYQVNISAMPIITFLALHLYDLISLSGGGGVNDDGEAL